MTSSNIVIQTIKIKNPYILVSVEINHTYVMKLWYGNAVVFYSNIRCVDSGRLSSFSINIFWDNVLSLIKLSNKKIKFKNNINWSNSYLNEHFYHIIEMQ